MSENFALSNEDISHPTIFKTIMRLQQRDNLKAILLSDSMGQVKRIFLSVDTGKL